MADSRRVERVAALIRREMSELLINGIRDERVQMGMISVTAVNVAGDLQHCRIFVSVLGSAEEREQALAGLRSASSYVKGELGRRLKMRRTPEVVFQLDKGLEKGTAVLGVLQRLENERQSRQKAEAEATAEADADGNEVTGNPATGNPVAGIATANPWATDSETSTTSAADITATVPPAPVIAATINTSAVSATTFTAIAGNRTDTGAGASRPDLDHNSDLVPPPAEGHGSPAPEADGP